MEERKLRAVARTQKFFEGVPEMDHIEREVSLVALFACVCVCGACSFNSSVQAFSLLPESSVG